MNAAAFTRVRDYRQGRQQLHRLDSRSDSPPDDKLAISDSGSDLEDRYGPKAPDAAVEGKY